MNEILEKVESKIVELGLTHNQAAKKIGITQNSLERHLGGDYVRSDSLAKYRIWLGLSDAQNQKNAVNQTVSSNSSVEQKALNLVVEPTILATRNDYPAKPYYVVDLFSGCGGMSLGFDRLSGGRVFKTVLALDIESSTVEVFNDNQQASKAGGQVARQADLTEFLNETEILAFYLKHLSKFDEQAKKDLMLEAGATINSFLTSIQKLDEGFLLRLGKIRSTPQYIQAFKQCGSHAMGQTSVIGFHRELKLPSTRIGQPKLDLMIWAGGDSKSIMADSTNLLAIDDELYLATKEKALHSWESALNTLEQRSGGTGSGQLSSSAKKIRSFLDLLRSEPFLEIKECWEDWQAHRESLRIQTFDDLELRKSLDRVYSRHPVSVLLGGPPCQGFSRIGRGKIRSLREQSVHVHEDDNSIDSRNNLMFQYVLFLSALAPKVFLFENVRHFKAVVKSNEQEFYAEDILEDAIKEVSDCGLSYSISSQIIRASNHSIPQDRERYFMAGVREGMKELTDQEISHWLLDLKRTFPLSLDVAFIGLPEPSHKSDDSSKILVDSSSYTPQPGNNSSRSIYLDWILGHQKTVLVDGHVARNHRQDDAGFFDLLGPGKRWMDYRCDHSPTVGQIRNLLQKVLDHVHKSESYDETFEVKPEDIEDVLNKLDGSLSLRLLLEAIPAQPGEENHHLITPNYLKKREGNHGDWLSRMDPSKPSKTMVSHMSKDTYAYIHPFYPRTISVREAARIQTFPDDFKFGAVGLVDAFKMIGNAVPPLLSLQLAEKVDQILLLEEQECSGEQNLNNRSELAVAAN